MTQSSLPVANSTPRTMSAGYLFGIPLADFGWFGSLLVGVASGFIAFFAATFCAIFCILTYNSAAHANLDFAISYKFIGLPIGLVVMAVALGYLGVLWFRRILRRS